MAKIVWKKTPRQAWGAGSKRYIASLRTGIFFLMQYWAVIVEAAAKDKAAWTDRTGNARQTLHARAEEMPSAVRLYLAHGMDYGKYLELANGGKYAIILPTLQEYQNQIFLGVKRLLK